MEYKSPATQYTCDLCGKILVGYERAVFKSNDYISIKGKISLQLVNKDTQQRYFVNIIPPGKDLLTLCDLACLDNYIRYQHAQYLKTRKARLMSTASAFTPPKMAKFHKWWCDCETCTAIRES